MVAMLVAMVLGNLRIIPRASPTYDTVLHYLIPVAIPLLLFDANLRRIIKETGTMLAAFLIGTVGTVLGAIIGFQLIPLGESGPALAGILASTYIGGSLNFVAVAQVTGFGSGSLMTATVAADNIVTAVYLIAIMALPGILFFQRRFRSPVIERAEADVLRGTSSVASAVPFDLFTVSTALGLAFLISALGYWLADVAGLDGFGILFISALALIPANLFPGLTRHLRGHNELGLLAVYLFLFVIGASADVWAMVGSALPITLFALLIVAVHMVFTLAVGGLLKMDLAELIIASNACVGGSSSAGPIAAARGWRELVAPAILLGSLGNAIGTFIGVAIWRFLA